MPNRSKFPHGKLATPAPYALAGAWLISAARLGNRTRLVVRRTEPNFKSRERGPRLYTVSPGFRRKRAKHAKPINADANRRTAGGNGTTVIVPEKEPPLLPVTLPWTCRK